MEETETENLPEKTSGIKIMGIVSFIGCWITILISVIAIFLNAMRLQTPLDISGLFQFSSLAFGIFATVWGAKAVYNFSPKAKTKEETK